MDIASFKSLLDGILKKTDKNIVLYIYYSRNPTEKVTVTGELVSYTIVPQDNTFDLIINVSPTAQACVPCAASEVKYLEAVKGS